MHRTALTTNTLTPSVSSAEVENLDLAPALRHMLFLGGCKHWLIRQPPQ